MEADRSLSGATDTPHTIRLQTAW